MCRLSRFGCALLPLVVSFCALTPPVPTLAQEPGVRDVGPLLRPVYVTNKVPGLAGAVVNSGRIVARGSVGFRKAASGVPITSRDRFHLGSCAKAMTATVLAMLVEEGKLSWDSTVPETLSDAVPAIHPAWRATRLDMLLTHTGGAPNDLRKDGLWGRLWRFTGEPTEHRIALAEGVLRNAPEAPPGSKYIYSNAGYALAGLMAETVTGKAWEELVAERLFKPLGMDSAGFGAPGANGTFEQPWGHTEDGKPVEPGPNADNPPCIAPAGTVHATLDDWAKFVTLHIDAERGNPRLLSAASFEILHTPKKARPLYAMGWGIHSRPWANGPVFTHNGSNTMWYCVVWMAPGIDLAVLVACNQGGEAAEKACESAAWALVEDHLGLQKARNAQLR